MTHFLDRFLLILSFHYTVGTRIARDIEIYTYILCGTTHNTEDIKEVKTDVALFSVVLNVILTVSYLQTAISSHFKSLFFP